MKRNTLSDALIKMRRIFRPYRNTEKNRRKTEQREVEKKLRKCKCEAPPPKHDAFLPAVQ
jgi:hypothetical protein